MHRDAILILIGLFIALIAGALLMFSFKEGALAPSGPAPVAFSVVAQGADSGMIDDRKNFRIKDAEELSALWAMVYGTDGPELPAVDFAKEEVLAVFAGTRPSGGYSVAVESVTEEPGRRAVAIAFSSPGASCIVTQAITSPFVMVRVAKSDEPLARSERAEVVECE